MILVLTSGVKDLTTDFNHQWNLGRRIVDTLKLDQIANYNLSKVKETWYHYIKNGGTSPEQLGYVYIYCAPCLQQIATAFDICVGKGIPRYLDFMIRIDDRISSSCCGESDGYPRLESIMNKVKAIEQVPSRSLLFDQRRINHVDSPWIERRVFELEQEPYEPLARHPKECLVRIFEECTGKLTSSSIECAGIVVLEETRRKSSIIESSIFQPQPRLPRATDIFLAHSDWDSASRGFLERVYQGSYSRNRDMRVLIPTPLTGLAAPTNLGPSAFAGSRGTKRSLSTSASSAHVSTAAENLE